MLAEITEISALARRPQFGSAGRCLKTDGQGICEECGPVLSEQAIGRLIARGTTPIFCDSDDIVV